MRGIILATKDLNLSKLTNSSNSQYNLTVYDMPIIAHAVHKLSEANIKDILIVTAENSGSIVDIIGNGSKYDCQVTYIQVYEKQSLVKTLKATEKFASKGPVVILEANEIFGTSLKKFVAEFKDDLKVSGKSNALVLLKKTKHANQYNCVKLDDKFNIISFHEPNQNTESDCAVVGCYFYDSHLYELEEDSDLNILDKIFTKNSLGFNQINSKYFNTEYKDLSYDMITGYWQIINSVETLYQANAYVAQHRKYLERNS